jgi:hypothetical protein
MAELRTTFPQARFTPRRCSQDGSFHIAARLFFCMSEESPTIGTPSEGLVTLREPVADESLLTQKPVVNLLHYPRLAADM